MSRAKILVVEDEFAIREMLVATLQAADFATDEADTVKEAYQKVIDQRPQLILLDWMLPDGETGLDLIYRLKKDVVNQDIPIIMLTAKGEEENRVRGLEAGVDDYIAKPFSTRELIGRIKAVLRRVGHSESTLRTGELSLNPVSQRVTFGDSEVPMSGTEYRLLHFFMSHSDRVYSRGSLLNAVWGANVYIEDRTVDVHIRRLRKALAPFGVDWYIQTVRGSGYRFSDKQK